MEELIIRGEPDALPVDVLAEVQAAVWLLCDEEDIPRHRVAQMAGEYLAARRDRDDESIEHGMEPPEGAD